MALLFLLTAALPVQAAPSAIIDVMPFVEEASQQTGVPVAVIWAVMGVESRGQIHAISPKGAMGMMQLMPGTWSFLRAQLGLGQDPFDPHDNIIAGAHYLRSLYDRYGWDGVFAAYNAGPGRYEAFRDKAQPLPAETNTYVGRIAERLAGKSYAFTRGNTAAKPISWLQSSLFAVDTSAPAAEATGFISAATPFVDLRAPSRDHSD